MKSFDFDFLRELSLEFGPCGCEKAVLGIIKNRIEKYCDETYYDACGNLIAAIKGKSEKITAFYTNVDEAGFYVKAIDDDGRARISLLGSGATEYLSGRRVSVGNGVKTYDGVVAARPIHSLSKDEETKPTSADKLYIELCTGKKEETEKLFGVGAFGTYKSEYSELAGRYIKCKALDARAGAAVMCDLIYGIDKAKTENGYYFCFTVMGSSGIRDGAAAAAAYNIGKCDLAVVLGTLGTSDLYGAEGRDAVCVCGEGAVISDSDGRTIYSAEEVKALKEKAEKAKIPYQENRACAGGGISADIQRGGEGVRTVCIEIPVKYPKTASVMINKTDCESALSLARLYITEE